MRRQTLRATIAKLEKRQRSRRPRQVVLYARYNDEEPDDRVTGVDGIAAPIADRRWNEALNTLVSRARAASGARTIMLARYPAPMPKTALCDDPDAMPEPAPLPVFDRHAPDPVRRWREFTERNGHETFA